MRVSLVLAAILWISTGWALAVTRAPHPCDSSARLQAAKLLAFHLKNDLPTAIDYEIKISDAIKTLPPVPNPSHPKQRLDVLELWGSAERGDFRVRLTFIPGGVSCTAIGQEVMNWASFN